MENNKRKYTPLLLSGPAIGLLVVFFVIPVGYLVVYSFSHYDPVHLVDMTFTLDNYKEFMIDSYLQETIFRTFRVAFLTSLISLVISYPLAFYMRMASGTEKSIIAVIILTPMALSNVVIGYAWMVLLAPNSGLVSQSLVNLGFLDGPLRFMNTEIGIVIGMVNFALVFMILNLHSSLETIDPNHLRAASILGAPPVQVFLRVVLPLSIPGILSGVLLVFSTSMSALMIPLMIGGRTKPLLSVLAYDFNRSLMNWPMGATVAIIMLIISVLTTFLLSYLTNRFRRGQELQ